MAYQYKGADILAPLSIRSNEPTFETTSVSLTTQRASQGAQRWELYFSVATSDATEAEMLVGVITDIHTAATMVMPQLPSVARNNTIGTSRAIVASASAGATSVRINNDGVLSEGTFIKFSNHDKLYMVTADATSGTNCTVGIYPALRTAVTTSHKFLTGSSATITYYRDIDSMMGLTFTDGLLSNPGTISLVEAI